MMFRRLVKAIRLLRYAGRMYEALDKIKDQDQWNTMREKDPTGDDYNTVVQIARDLLDEIDRAEVPWWRVDPAFADLSWTEIEALYG